MRALAYSTIRVHSDKEYSVEKINMWFQNAKHKKIKKNYDLTLDYIIRRIPAQKKEAKYIIVIKHSGRERR